MRSLPAALPEREPRRVRVELDPGVELEEALVDAAELLGAEVAVVDEAEAAVLLDRGEGADRVEEVLVAQVGRVEVRARLGSEQERAERRQRERRSARREPRAAMTRRRPTQRSGWRVPRRRPANERSRAVE